MTVTIGITRYELRTETDVFLFCELARRGWTGTMLITFGIESPYYLCTHRFRK